MIKKTDNLLKSRINITIYSYKTTAYDIFLYLPYSLQTGI